MAFWGSVLKPGETTTLDAEAGTLFHLSQACLSDPKDDGKNYLVANVEDKKFFLCCLQKEKTEHFALDCFFSTEAGVSFTNNGKSEMHIVGYLESKPEEHVHDENCMHGDEEEESEEDADEGDEEESDDDEVAAAKVPEAKKAAAPKKEAVPAPKAKAAATAPAPKKEEKKPEAPKKEEKKAEAPKKEEKKSEAPKKEEKKPEAKASPAAPADKKRKAEEPAAAPQPDKKPKQETAKPAESKPAASGDDAAFQKSIEDYLKKNGRTDMAKLGSSVKKPAGVSSKLGQFIKARPDVFKVDGNFVEVVKK